MIELATRDGHKLSAYRADPEGAPRGAVIVLQQGAEPAPHICKMADLFASRGYVAIAPALDPEALAPEPATEANDTASSNAPSGTAQALAVVQAAIDSAAGAGKVALVGYSWGSAVAYEAANAIPDLACTVCYYGEGIVDASGGKRRVPTLVHFAGNDNAVPSEKVVQFRASRPDVSAYSYPDVSHGFGSDGEPGYDAAAAEAALSRTLFWLSQFIDGQPPVTLKNAGAYALAKTDKKKKKKEGGDDLGPPMD
jgi:carboxymethylenebutenolidase